MVSRQDHIESQYIGYITGNLTSEEIESLEERLRTDAEFAQLWNRIDSDFRSLPEVPPADSSELKNKLRVVKSVKKRKKLQPLWIAAASLLLLSGVFSSILYYNHQRISGQFTATNEETPLENSENVIWGNALGEVESVREKFDQEAITENTLIVLAKQDVEQFVQTPPGMDIKIKLEDGTIAWLNGDSKLTIAPSFSAKSRHVEMDGEIYFDVAHLPESPFEIQIPKGSITVLGTSFNVRADNETASHVALVSGKVQLKDHAGHEIMLKNGQSSSIDGASPLTAEPFDSDVELSWMKGVYHFYDMPLEELQTKISRWCGIDLRIDDAELKQYHVSGLINKRHVEGFLKNLKKSTGINYQLKGKSVYLSKPQTQ